MDINRDANEAIDKLKEILELFPYRCCKFAVKEMSERGYEIVQGIVKLDNYCGLGQFKERIHYWSFDPETQQNIDITASQLNIHLSDEKKLPYIAIWKDGQLEIYVTERTRFPPSRVI